MAVEEQTLAEVMDMLEAEPLSGPGVVAGLSAPGPDIPALREQLSVLVLTGKAKEAVNTRVGEASLRQRC